MNKIKLMSITSLILFFICMVAYYTVPIKHTCVEYLTGELVCKKQNIYILERLYKV